MDLMKRVPVNTEGEEDLVASWARALCSHASVKKNNLVCVGLLGFMKQGRSAHVHADERPDVAARVVEPWTGGSSTRAS